MCLREQPRGAKGQLAACEDRGNWPAPAEEVGADFVIDVSNEDPIEKITEITNGIMADLVVDLSSASLVPGLCLELVRYGGDVIWAGLKDREAVPASRLRPRLRGDPGAVCHRAEGAPAQREENF